MKLLPWLNNFYQQRKPVKIKTEWDLLHDIQLITPENFNSYDLLKWAERVSNEYGVTIECVLSSVKEVIMIGHPITESKDWVIAKFEFGRLVSGN